MKISHRIVLITLLALTTQAYADASLESARQTLKDYGLTRCLMAAWPDDSTVRDDLAAASQALHYMGRGRHGIMQDENTVQAPLDPYRMVDTFVQEAYAEHAAYMKDGSENALLGCLAVYHLEEFERLVAAQDGLVED